MADVKMEVEPTLTTKAIVTKPAPKFSTVAVMPNGDFKQVSLCDYKGKYVVLFFYPLDFTFVCPTEIIAFSDRVEEFKKLNCEVLACSVDSQYSHLAWTELPRKKGGLGPMAIPLLADVSRKISTDYGVLMDTGFTLRGLFIIDGKGTLRHITMNDPPVGRNVDEILRLVEAYQFTDENGEVCPINWKPGSKTIKPNPVEKTQYFEAANN